jgi:predicted DsbA family dithiol-disulfide isomerase
VAVQAGLDRAIAAAALVSPEWRSLVERDEQQAQAFGISGVPTFVFNRQVGFSGAQEVAEFLGAIDQVARA